MGPMDVDENFCYLLQRDARRIAIETPKHEYLQPFGHFGQGVVNGEPAIYQR